MNKRKLKEIWKKEEEKSFIGWDFSYLNNRIEEEQIPWDYKKIIYKYLDKNDLLLDMGTGGGEFLLTLNHPYHNTFVTESYLPNLELCKNKLGKLGIDVRNVTNDSALPFESGMFDIIINRHESYDINEVYRVLKNKGLFITQQVGMKNNLEFSKYLLQDYTRTSMFNNSLEKDTMEAVNLGFNILRKEEVFPYLKFFDVAALVYFAKIIEWEFPKFSVDRCFEQLIELQKQMTTNGFIISKEHRYLIVAQKE